MASKITDAVVEILSRGPASALELARALEVHQTTLSRVLRPLEQSGRVIRILGTTRGARYGLARAVGAAGSAWPLYRIDDQGAPTELGTLQALERDGFAMRGGPSRIEGLHKGLPYYLQDARPAGFLGRSIPAAFPELDLPARVQDWTDAHVISYLIRRGSDSVGNLILGTEALDRYLAGQNAPLLIAADARAVAYPECANAAMLGALAGSSAHGEHPKFSARIGHGRAITHVLVKFSPPRDTPSGVRWADLLIAEHLAAQVLGERGIFAARSELLEHRGRVFLQSERFDRSGSDGRRGVASLYSIDVDRYGRLDSWSLAAQRLQADGLLSSQDRERIALLDTFGDLIGNTDRHFGNITLFDVGEGQFELAPVYDMLPMLFAPQDGQLVERAFEPAGLTAVSLSVWGQARELAQIYWKRLCDEPRLTESFRRLGTRCLETLRKLPERGAAKSVG
jgi:hypothetical protein